MISDGATGIFDSVLKQKQKQIPLWVWIMPKVFKPSTANEKGSFHCEFSEVSAEARRWGNDDWIFQRKLAMLLCERVKMYVQCLKDFPGMKRDVQQKVIES